MPNKLFDQPHSQSSSKGLPSIFSLLRSVDITHSGSGCLHSRHRNRSECTNVMGLPFINHLGHFGVDGCKLDSNSHDFVSLCKLATRYNFPLRIEGETACKFFSTIQPALTGEQRGIGPTPATSRSRQAFTFPVFQSYMFLFETVSC